MKLNDSPKNLHKGGKELFTIHESFLHKVFETKSIVSLNSLKIYQHVLVHHFLNCYIVFLTNILTLGVPHKRFLIG